jgi:hypothetical protein
MLVMSLFAPLAAALKFVRATAAVVAFVPPCATVTGVAVKADVTICVGVALFVVAPPPVTSGKTSVPATSTVAAGSAVIFTSAMIILE